MTNSKTFRLFISSTFSDFQLERELLHKEVFPELEQYCESRGCQFQPIDLRWGVNFEAQLDQKTLQVCLDEVRACKHYPHPNFLIMVGERYGWVPLPYAIEKDEFEQIVHYHKQKDRSGLHLQNYPFEIALLQHWYQLDENHFMESDTQKIPRSCAYVLRAREDWSNEKNGSSKKIALPFRKDYVTPNDEKKENNVNWNQDEGILLRALKEAVEHIKTKISQDAYSKYFLSATEQEVIEGICDYRHITHTQKYDETCSGQKHQIEKQYIHGYLRDVSDQEDLSNAQNKFRSQLEKALLLKNITRGSDAKAFAKEIKARLEIAIDDALKGQDDNSPQAILKNERREQLAFRGSKLKGYVERTKSQSAITAYLESEESMQPFILHAPSGMGKSAVMAKAIEELDSRVLAKLKKMSWSNTSKRLTLGDYQYQLNEFCKDSSHKIVYRFVGATARSREMRSLLISITTEITQDHDRVYEEDSNKFNEQIKEIFENLKEPTILFIDALDQLLEREYLMWLPEILPAHLKIVLSVLNDPEYAQDSHYYNILQSRFNSADFFNLEDDPIEDTTALIENLLGLEQRTLTPQQQHYLSRQFEVSKRSPLWMKIAIEEVKQWSSDQKEYELKVGVKAIINEFIDNLHEFYHHQPLLVEKVLGYIHASKVGLSEKELLDILSEDLHDEEVFQKQILNKFHDPIKVNNPRRGNQKELVLPLAHWSRLHVQLKPFLVTTNIDNQQLMKFFHRQFTTVIQERSAQQSQRYHAKLAEYFLTLQDKNKTWDQRYFNLRMLEETPYQLFKAKKAQQLKALLFDLEFAGSVYDHGKQQSFRAVMEKATELEGITEDEIYPWESFYREKEHLITRVDEELWRPHQSLFQLAYEDGDNSPCTKCAESLFNTDSIEFAWLKRAKRKKEFLRTGLVAIVDKTEWRGMSGIRVHNKEVVYSKYGDIYIWNFDTKKKMKATEAMLKKLISDNIVDDDLELVKLKNERFDCLNNKVLKKENDFQLLDLKTKEFIILEKNSRIYDAKFLSEKKAVSYESLNGVFSLWNLEELTSTPLIGHTAELKGITLLKDGRFISYAMDNKIILWDINNQSSKEFIGHTSHVNDVQVLDDSYIVSVSMDRSIRIWDINITNTAKSHQAIIQDFQFIDENRIVFNSGDTINIYSLKDETIKSYREHTAEIKGIKVLSNNKVFSYEWGGIKKVWNFQNDKYICNDVKELENEVFSFDTFKLLNNHAAVFFNQYSLTLWEIEKMQIYQFSIFLDDSQCEKIQVLNDETIFIYSSEKIIYKWNSLEDNEPTKIDSIDEYEMIFFDDGKMLLKKEDATCLLQNLENGEKYSFVLDFDDITGIEILNNNEILIFNANELLLINPYDDSNFTKFIGHTDSIKSVKTLNDGIRLTSSDNEIICSYGNDGTVRLWDRNGNLLTILFIAKETSTLMIHKDQMIIATNGDICLYDFYFGNEIRPLEYFPCSLIEGWKI